MASPSQHADTARRQTLIDHAETVCRERGVAFTPIRREVFALLCRHRRPVGAYELLEELKASRPRAVPVTIYRALDFLLGNGLAHKVNALNAFTACRGSDLAHRGLMLICAKCSAVIEMEDRGVESSIERSAARAEFEAGAEPVEVVGTCAECQQ